MLMLISLIFGSLLNLTYLLVHMEYCYDCYNVLICLFYHWWHLWVFLWINFSPHQDSFSYCFAYLIDLIADMGNFALLGYHKKVQKIFFLQCKHNIHAPGNLQICSTIPWRLQSPCSYPFQGPIYLLAGNLYLPLTHFAYPPNPLPTGNHQSVLCILEGFFCFIFF